jgi:hypothetical protein
MAARPQTWTLRTLVGILMMLMMLLPQTWTLRTVVGTLNEALEWYGDIAYGREANAKCVASEGDAWIQVGGYVRGYR